MAVSGHRSPELGNFAAGESEGRDATIVVSPSRTLSHKAGSVSENKSHGGS